MTDAVELPDRAEPRFGGLGGQARLACYPITLRPQANELPSQLPVSGST